MDTKIYYDHRDPGLLVTSNIQKYEKQIDLGLYPNADFQEIDFSDIHKFKVDGISFDEVANEDFPIFSIVLTQHEFQTVSFQNTKLEVFDTVLNVKHLIIGENTAIDISSKKFKGLDEITFLSVKTFRGKVLDDLESVRKLILWYENKRSNDLLAHFPNLNDFQIFNGAIVALDLRNNPHIERLELHRCIKLEVVHTNDHHNFKVVIIESCKKLKDENLGSNVSRW